MRSPLLRLQPALPTALRLPHPCRTVRRRQIPLGRKLPWPQPIPSWPETNFGNEINGKFGVALVSGRSIYLHKSPIAGMIKFSIDLGADINYAQYLPAEGDYNMDSSLTEDIGIGISGRHHLDIGMFLGPAVSVNPVGDLMVTAYFRFVPSYSAFFMDVDAYHGFTPFFTYGGEVTWKWIGLGIEGRSGYGSYSSIMSLFNGGESMKAGYATQAVRCYVSFRF